MRGRLKGLTSVPQLERHTLHTRKSSQKREWCVRRQSGSPAKLFAVHDSQDSDVDGGSCQSSCRGTGKNTGHNMILAIEKQNLHQSSQSHGSHSSANLLGVEWPNKPTRKEHRHEKIIA